MSIFTADDFFPETDFNIEPVGNKLLVQLPLAPEKTSGGLFLPDVTVDLNKAAQHWGKVIAIGPDAYQDTPTDTFGEPWCKVGDYVKFPRFESNKTVVGKVEAVVIDDTRVFAKIKDPTKVSFEG